MCGIVGVARGRDAPPVEAAVVRRMADAIVHRGPDDEGFYSDEYVTLGMRRLSIIDLAGGHQPIANEDEKLWAVCNGEIYNYREIRADLVARGHRFRTESDVEVLLHLYEEFGERFLERVSGMFAVALWDQRRERLILARDRLGIKPLYYVEAGGVLGFASEIKSLLRLPFVKARLDRAALSEYLGFGYAVAPQTIFEGIRKLPPATMLVWGREGIRRTTYWQMPARVKSGLADAEWIERVRHELDRAVAEHMISDVPIGAFLSGGVDSSAIVALMARHSAEPVNTYSIGYSGSAAADYYNELSFAKIVAKKFGTHHTEIPVTPNAAALLPRLLWHVEEPISDSAIVTTFLVSELAARNVKVILSGVGGDELFAGYKRYLGDFYSRRYRKIAGWIRRLILAPVAGMLPSGRQNRFMDLARYARKFVAASDLPWDQQYRAYVEICDRRRLGDLLSGATTERVGFDRICDAERAEDDLLRLMRVDSQTQLAEDLLLLTDKITMATSIECRVPFLDHGLVEVAAQVPSGLKLHRGELKYVLKRALVGIVPDEVLFREKRGFGAPMGAWLKGELKALRDHLLSQRTVESRGWLSWSAVRQVIDDHDAHREDFTDLLLVLVNLEIWSRLFLDGRGADDVAGELAELSVRR
jgi:asparagine synthase (glutamine-hydrolysing)